MLRPQPAIIRETGNVPIDRRTSEPGEVEGRHPPGASGEESHRKRSYPRILAATILALTALAISGCMTMSEPAPDGRSSFPGASGALATGIVPGDIPGREPSRMARLQSPAVEVGGGNAGPSRPAAPALPDPGLPSTAAGTSPASVGPTTVDPAAIPPPVAEAGAPVARDSPAPRGLSSIARNRLANRRPAAPPAAGGVPAGATPGRPAGPGSGDVSPRLFNRLLGSVAPGERPQFNYPDIHADPAKTYHDRFGIEEDHDPFLFPWLMNVIFEDRWLLAEKEPEVAVQNQYRRRMKIDIRDPDPDTANFPNGAYTLPKGRLYIENSPLGLYGSSKSTPRIYQWEYLVRYGLTDNLEFRIFSNGLTMQAKRGKQPAITGYSPLAFDFKANFWEENTKYHIPAMGIEVYLQTTFGSPALDAGTQPSMSVLFDQSLPLGVGFEYNLGIVGVQDAMGQTRYQFNFAWSFQREVVKDFDVFVHGFYNETGLPRLTHFHHLQYQASLATESVIPAVNVVGVGAIKTVNDRLAVFGSYNLGTTTGAPHTIALTGFAVAF